MVIPCERSSRIRSSPVTATPPSPTARFLLENRLNAPETPTVPRCRPSRRAPAACAASLLGRRLEVTLDEARVRPPNSEVQLLLSRPERMRELTGWTAQVDLKTGLARTIEWIEANPRRFRTEQYVV